MARLRATEPPDLPAFWSGPDRPAAGVGTMGPKATPDSDPAGSVASWGEPLTPDQGPSVRVVRPLQWRAYDPPQEE